MMSAQSRLLAVVLVLVLTATAAGAAPAAGASAAEADLNLMLSSIRANRRALIAVNLNLPADEAAKFWPLYDRYQTEMNGFGDRLAALLADYSSHYRDLSNDKALQLMKDYLAIEADRAEARRIYFDEFAKALPGRTVARFFQIDNKMDAVLRYDLAAAIPVVDEASPPPAK